jgi:hypothetical protein
MSTQPILNSGISTNIPGASDFIPNMLGRINFGNNQRILQLATDDTIQKAYNSGNVNPYSGPTARSLFYNAATYSHENAKYGQFLFYSIVGNHDPDFYENYYLSERTEYNTKVTPSNPISGASKNPSAGFLVRQTQDNLGGPKSKGFSYFFSPRDTGSYIIGGASAPYFWKDFLFCKYYGHIPNNYMITLRRFPSPMKDNLSLPDRVKNTDVYRVQGAGKPVAQAVTWWGGNTGNTLNNIIGFTTGLKWSQKTQQELINQDGFAKGLFSFFSGLLGEEVAENLGLGVIRDVSDVAVNASNSGFRESAGAARNNYLRDKAVSEGGPLSDFIWVSVDTIDSMKVRARGLIGAGEDESMSLKFHYELTSAGEVNSKASFVDIIGNLLGLCTNYGNFLTPEIRYNNRFPAVNFPGGDAGLASLYTNPVEFIKKLTDYANNPEKGTNGDPILESFSGLMNQTKKLRDVAEQTVNQLKGGNLPEGSQEYVDNFAKYSIMEKFINNVVFPAAILTGMPTGEWHLVVGNPCNPVAMIGNLICTGLSIEFGEVLGPDDFPTEITATIGLQMARPRERGEIESMFNRGEGRLYQSVQPVYSNSQSIGAFGTVTGEIVLGPNSDKTTDINVSWNPINTSEAYTRD